LGILLITLGASLINTLLWPFDNLPGVVGKSEWKRLPAAAGSFLLIYSLGDFFGFVWSFETKIPSGSEWRDREMRKWVLRGHV